MPTQLYIHAGYLLMLAALLARDILWLRLLLMAAQSCLATFGWLSGHPAMALWNAGFVLLNGVQVARLVRERRPIRLEPGLQAIHSATFPLMKPREFLLFWEMGNPLSRAGGSLIREGERQRDLLLLVEGSVQVMRQGRVLATLGPGAFLAEMSFLTGEPASADVVADGPVRFQAWPQDKLMHLQQLNPRLLLQVHGVLGRDLVGKVRSASG